LRRPGVRYTTPNKPYTLSLHDALPIFGGRRVRLGKVHPPTNPRWPDRAHRRRSQHRRHLPRRVAPPQGGGMDGPAHSPAPVAKRSEEHTSELQSRENLVCRLLLEKKKL